MRFRFTKMHGLGNDFVIIDSRRGRDEEQPGFTLDPSCAAKICDRRFGIGADQILWLLGPHDPSADLRMEIWNADGSTAEMCGNGIRAVALYVDRRAKAAKPEYRIETAAGMKLVRVNGGLVTVDMGPPLLAGGAGLSAEGEAIELPGRSEKLRFFEVGMGNPHAVFFVENAASVPVEQLGPAVEHHSRFPKRTNVEFVQVEDRTTIRVRVWERGAGVTLACGTGACASAVAALATGRARGPVRVRLPGGDLEIAWAGPGAPVFMTGPAVEVFSGEAEI